MYISLSLYIYIERERELYIYIYIYIKHLNTRLTQQIIQHTNTATNKTNQRQQDIAKDQGGDKWHNPGVLGLVGAKHLRFRGSRRVSCYSFVDLLKDQGGEGKWHIPDFLGFLETKLEYGFSKQQLYMNRSCFCSTYMKGSGGASKVVRQFPCSEGYVFMCIYIYTHMYEHV